MPILHVEEILRERNRSLGKLLSESRLRKSVSVSKCANLINTSRKRYDLMEKGESMINVAELEVLFDFLGVPKQAIWQDSLDQQDMKQVVVRAQPGERFQIVLDIA